MADQPVISDYFSSRKRNVSSKRKKSTIVSPPSKKSRTTTVKSGQAHKNSESACTTKENIKGGPPAHERFQNLLDSKPKSIISIGLSLPNHFNDLLDIFIALDTVVSRLYNEKGLCIFDKICKSVQMMVKKTFDANTLNQIRAVYANAYSLHYEEVAITNEQESTKEYKLIVDPNLQSDDTSTRPRLKRHSVFSESQLLQRRKTFHKHLVQIVYKCHEKFLVSELGLAISDVPTEDTIKQWHLKFSLDSVPPVIPADSIHRPEDAKDTQTAESLEETELTKQSDIKQEAPGELIFTHEEKGSSLESTASSISCDQPDTKCTLKEVSNALTRKINILPAKEELQDVNPAPESSPNAIPAHKRYQHLIDTKSASSNSTPAHERFQHLVDTKTEPSSPIPPGLNLPNHMKVLFEIFKASETVVSILYNRKELCVFDKISESVQKIVKKTFEERTLNQIRAVYDSAYSLRYEKLPVLHGPKSSKHYKLIVDPNLRSDGTGMALSSPTKGHLVFTGNRLIQRKTTFHKHLIKIVSKFHETFLVSKLGHSINDLPPVDKIQRWHPKFLLDSIPVITPAEAIPRPEGADSPRITRASEAVALFRDKGMKREALCALKAALGTPGIIPTNEVKNPVVSSTAPSAKPTSNKSNLNGVSNALLEKIRAKETRIRNERMMRGAGDETRRAMISRLPEMSTLIWSIFSSAKRPALSWGMISQRIAQSHRSGLLKSSVDEHIKILLELAPDWIERVDYAEPHLRVIDMKRPIKQVHDLIISKMN